LNRLFEKRNNLKNLISKMDGNDKLEALLTQIMKNNDNLQKLKKEIQEYDDEHNPKPAEATEETPSSSESGEEK
jgi:type VI secretion system protein ImpB